MASSLRLPEGSRKGSGAGWSPILLFLAFIASATLQAAPWKPASDSMVVENVPAAGQLRELQPLRRAVAERPDDPLAAVVLARAYLKIARNSGDPRFLSYSEATLTPWLTRAAVPADVLIVAAITLQSSHRFDAALALLDRALRMEPRNAQAQLTRATILQVRGEFPAARRACAQLIQTAGQLIAVACLSGVDGMTGRLKESRAALAAVFVQPERLDAELRSWIHGELGDMALRLGDVRQAEEHYRAGLRATPQDAYLQAALADLLLARGRYADVLGTLRDEEAQDALLLRLAIAAAQAGDSSAQRYARLYEERFAAARHSGDLTHQREHARYQLEVAGKANEALQIAQRNWQVQREAADVTILLRSACAAHATAAHAQISAWIRSTGFQDVALTPLLSCMRSTPAT